MYTVFDIIAALCKWRGYTMKDLASKMELPYSTLATMMSHRPSRISKSALTEIASVFRVEWYQLLGYEAEPESIPQNVGHKVKELRVGTSMSEDAVNRVLKATIGEDYEPVNKYTPRFASLNSRRPQKEDHAKDTVHLPDERFLLRSLYGSIDLAFDRLNGDGKIEAFRYILELSQNPKYKKNAEQNTTKEDN